MSRTSEEERPIAAVPDLGSLADDFKRGQGMSAKKDRYPSGTHGWGGEVRAETIDALVQSRLRLDGRRTYLDAHEAASELARTGKSHKEIQKELDRAPNLQQYSGEDSPRRNDEKKAHNIAEEELTKIRRSAIQDALAGKPPSAPTIQR